MSFDLMRQVWDLQLTPAEKITLLALCDLERGHGVWPSVATLADMTGLSKHGVSDQLTRLIERGLLKPETPRHGGREKTTRYQIIIEAQQGQINHEPDSCFTGETTNETRETTNETLVNHEPRSDKPLINQLTATDAEPDGETPEHLRGFHDLVAPTLAATIGGNGAGWVLQGERLTLELSDPRALLVARRSQTLANQIPRLAKEYFGFRVTFLVAPRAVPAAA